MENMRHSLIKKTCCCILATLLASQMAAQDVSPSKRINNIKRDSQYIFAEATGKTSEEATEMANMLLEKYIGEYIEQQEKLDVANNVIVKDACSTSEKIEVPRGTMTRVFVYVKKSNIEPAQSVQTINREQRQQANLPETTVEEIESVSETTLEMETTREAANDPSLPMWQMRVIMEIAKQTSLIDVRQKLNTYKVQHKVKRIGMPAEPCQTPDGAFYVFADAGGQVTALLGRQSGNGRLNYLTGQQDSLEAHSSETRMWFTLNK